MKKIKLAVRRRWIVLPVALFAIHFSLPTSEAHSLSLPAGEALSAGEVQNMAEVFKQMPDSLLPYLTTNNRLDMVDFMEAKMKAEVTNLLDGKSEMTALTDDSLSIRMSPSLRVDMQLVSRDSIIVAFRQTYTISESQQATVTRYYSTSWLPLPIAAETTSTLARRDEEVFVQP